MQKSGEPFLQIEGVSKKFADGTLALSDVSFSICKNQFTVIAGPNGSGKTVLMELIAGLEKPTSGKITFFNEENGKPAKAGLIFQDADSQILGETPYEDVCFGAKNSGLKGIELNQAAEKALRQTGLFEKKDVLARTMSGGEKRRLAVAGILCMNCDPIIFDEPFANLDWPGVRQVCAALKDLKESGKTVIVLTHEIEKVLALSDRLIVLQNGRLQFDGSAKEGLEQNLEQWGIRNPLVHYKKFEDLLWL